MKRVLLTYFVLAIGLGGLLPGAAAQDEIESNRQQWDEMGREERDTTIEAYHRWKGMDEARRESIRARYRCFRALPEEERFCVALNLHRLCAMGPGRQRLVRAHLRIAPEERVRQLAVMRTMSLLGEGGDGPFPRERVAREFRKREYNLLWADLTSEQKGAFKDISGKDRFRMLRERVLRKIEVDLERRPPSDLPPRGSPGYGRNLRGHALRRYHRRLVEQMPPAMEEMAHFIRMHAPAGLPPGLTSEIIDSLSAGLPGREVSEKARELMETEEMARLIDAMPERMRGRYRSGEFDRAKRLRVILMAFQPFTRLRPGARHRYFSHGRPPLGRRRYH